MTSINSLKADHKNARKRTDRSAELIKESLERYGAARSIVVDEENRILAGNGTVEGAKAAGIKNVRIIDTEGDEIIAIRRTGLSEDEKVGLALADNRTSDLSEWDQEMLHHLSKEHDLAPWFEQTDLDSTARRCRSSIPRTRRRRQTTLPTNGFYSSRRPSPHRPRSPNQSKSHGQL
jgi:hypothetical protein